MMRRGVGGIVLGDGRPAGHLDVFGERDVRMGAECGAAFDEGPARAAVYLTSIWRAVDTGCFLPSTSVRTPFSSFALVAPASISSGSS